MPYGGTLPPNAHIGSLGCPDTGTLIPVPSLRETFGGPLPLASLASATPGDQWDQAGRLKAQAREQHRPQRQVHVEGAGAEGALALPHPLTSFAEPEGPKGARTRTWVTVKGQPIAAWGGLWRDSEEWGAVYSGAMTDCNDAMRPLHDRMPVLLLPDEFDVWLRGSFDELVALQKRCFPNELIEIGATKDLWVPKKPATPGEKVTLI